MRILIIEDEAGIAQFVQQGLEEEGYQVEVAAQGFLGLEKALSQQFDLLLVDWMLPGMTGVEICRAVRKENEALPIIFLTAKDTVQDTVTGLQAGANDYIRKPFHFEELLERIRVQLRPQAQELEQLRLGEIVVDVAQYQVWKGSEEVFLTRKELELLEYLLRHKGRVCRRQQILEEVWDIDFEYNSGIIDVYINALRKKLHLKKDEDYIQTIRGVGYIAKD